jgi:hypothetical protein
MMKISDGKLQEFECALSQDRHFIEQPIALTCGHCICKKCVPKELILPLKCNICTKITHRDIRNDEESVLSKKAFQLSINDLFLQIEKSFTQSMTHLKGNFINVQTFASDFS